ncbi:VWA domain-containing protein [Streptomyces sp. R44]|uniref:VWA domain-containing protein n=1 Tax=Streptomyces sp. R44 TaxID=3238633 RepID=A0AB39T2P1_9ACTN
MGIRSMLRKVFGRDREESPATSVPPQTRETPEATTAPDAPATPEAAARRAADDLVAASFDNPQIPKARTAEAGEPEAAAASVTEPAEAAPAEPEPTTEAAEPEAEAVEAAEPEAPVAAEEPELAAEVQEEAAEPAPAAEATEADAPEAAAEQQQEAPAAEATDEAAEPEADAADEPQAEAVEAAEPEAPVAAEEPELAAEVREEAAEPAAEATEPEEEATEEPQAEATEADAPEAAAEQQQEEAPAAEATDEAAEPETDADDEPQAEVTTPAEPVAVAAAEPEAEVAPEPEAQADEVTAAPALPLAALKASAPHLADAYKAAGAQLKKQGLTGARAAVYLVVDRSGSMRGYFKDGSVQRLAEQVTALAAHLDEAATVTTVFFSTDIDGTVDLAPADLTPTRIDEVNATLGRLGRTNYHRAVEEVLAHHEKHDPARPALVVFQTDGAPESKTAATQALAEAADRPLHWRFVAWGEEDNKAFDFLRKLDGTPRTGTYFAGVTPVETAHTAFYRGLLAGLEF